MDQRDEDAIERTMRICARLGCSHERAYHTTACQRCGCEEFLEHLEPTYTGEVEERRIEFEKQIVKNCCPDVSGMLLAFGVWELARQFAGLRDQLKQMDKD